MADSNWIKLNRGIWDNFIWDFDNPKYALAWIDMLLMANYKDKKILFDGQVETVKRGSFITSMVKLSERWGMNRKTVKRLLDTLQNDGMITYTCTNRRTAINIVNYGVYQNFGGGEGTTEYPTDGTAKGTAEYPTDGTQHKKVKNIKEIKNNNTYSDIPELNEALLAFVEYRKKIKKPMEDHAVKLMISKLNKMTPDVEKQIEIINQSIVNGWQGIFPLKEQKSGRKEPEPDWMKKKNSFHNFEQRDYDFKDLEKKFIAQLNGEKG